MKITSYTDAINTLEKAFDYFNNHFCTNKLQRPIIVSFPKGRKKVFGWHWKGRWTSSEDEQGRTELNIAAEHLNRDPKDVLETLLHEMTHYYNSSNGVSDCNAQQRHNKKFKEVAESVFKLICERDKVKGWCYTKLGEEAEAVVNQFIRENNIESFDLCRTSPKQSYVKGYFVSVERDDKAWFDEYRQEHEMSSKELFTKMRELFEQKNID